MAAAIAIAFFSCWMDLMRAIWPAYMQLQVDYNLPQLAHIAIYTIPQHIFNYTVGNLLCFVLYISKIPFFEHYRSRGHPDEQWPWEFMPKDEWRKLLYRSLWFNALNSVVSNLSINVFFWAIDKDVPHPTDIESMPGPLCFAAQIIFCMICEDLTFYFSHRMLH